MPFEPPPAVHAAALWSGLLIILMLLLSVLVTRQRRAHDIAHGHGDEPRLTAAVRAFGNAAEYVPAGIGGLMLLALAGAMPLVVHLAGVSLFAGRVIHAIGLSRSAGTSLFRSVGMIVTWVSYLFTAVALLVYAIPS